MGTTVFINERKHAEQAARESEQRYTRLLASVTDYVYSVSIDQGRPAATAHGPGCEAVTGYTSREFENDPSCGPASSATKTCRPPPRRPSAF